MSSSSMALANVRRRSTTQKQQQQQQQKKRPLLVQSTLGFFDVPESSNVAVVSKSKNTKQKKNDTSSSSLKRKETSSKAPQQLSDQQKKSKRTTSATTIKTAAATNVTLSSSSTIQDLSSLAVTTTTKSQKPSYVPAVPSQQDGASSSSSVKENDPNAPESTTTTTTDTCLPYTRVPSSFQKKNIVLQLQQQSLQGLAYRITAAPPQSTTTTTNNNNNHWSNASWLKLQCPRQGTPLTTGTPIQIMEWDPMGVLLAVMLPHDSILRIYDWDTVTTMDAKGRNHRLRRKNNSNNNNNTSIVDYTAGGSYRIDATLHANVRVCGNQIRKFAWNPYSPDQIVILDSNNLLHMFDLANEAARQQRARGGSSGTAASAPTKVELPFRRRVTTADLLFLTMDTLIVAAGDQLACISLRNSSVRRTGGVVVPSNKWVFTWKDNIVSSMARLGSDLVMLGSNCGNLSVIDWKKTQMAAFSTIARPVVLDSWFSANGLRHPGSMHMGIHRLTVEEQPQLELQNSTYLFGDTRISWVASCGWAMSTVIDVTTGKPVGKAQRLHQTAPVRCVNHRNESVNVGGKAGWSLPAQELQSCGTLDFLCWERVPDVVQVLPDHDKFVLNDRPRQVTLARQRQSLHVMNRWTGQMHEVLLPKGQHRISALAMHSGNEWILVATETDGIRFYNARKKF